MSKPLTQTTGRRKRAVARVRVRPGTGVITVNRREVADYFPSETHRMVLTEPLRVDQHGRDLRHRRHPRRRRPLGPGRRPAPRHLPGPGRPRPRAAGRAQEGRLPHPRRPREGEQEVRPQEGAQGSAVLEALIAAAVAAVRHRRRPRPGHELDRPAGARPRAGRGGTVLGAGSRVRHRSRHPRVGAPPRGGAGRRAGRRRRRRSRRSAWCRPRWWRWCAPTAGVPGAVISASHNRYADNGIKFFAPGGLKLTDAVEERPGGRAGPPDRPGRRA